MLGSIPPVANTSNKEKKTSYWGDDDDEDDDYFGDKDSKSTKTASRNVNTHDQNEDDEEDEQAALEKMRKIDQRLAELDENDESGELSKLRSKMGNTDKHITLTSMAKPTAASASRRDDDNDIEEMNSMSNSVVSEEDAMEFSVGGKSDSGSDSFSMDTSSKKAVNSKSKSAQLSAADSEDFDFSVSEQEVNGGDPFLSSSRGESRYDYTTNAMPPKRRNDW